ncbi:hypothetical protein E2R68_02525 [Psychromonas sp. RZ22]|uniref:SirB2 family protein n=1 Tax=Psychromonas algarum TaxID=2555643 RepID=UPI0010673A6E|nr:SirB2 family protein [Psychromonas sp. RZ22]TEW55986.1 hypothetical protein E2R68_02525 [Psychromonas sp. RZ22]
MYSILKHAHMTFILIAVILFIVRFYWLKTNNANSQKVVFKKIQLHSTFTIIALGLGLMGYLHLNPFATGNAWLLEKLIAFAAYFIMVQVALNEKTKTHIQWITFIGAFGWLAFIAKLAITKQAILLVG